MDITDMNQKILKNIMIVEDNPSNYMLIARLLNHENVNCEWKTSGFEVVEYAQSIGSIDLILMDIRLPYENGYQAFAKIRQSSQYKDVPIIAVTAESSSEEMNKAKTAGFEGFIGKPIDPNQFFNQVLAVFNGGEVWEL